MPEYITLDEALRIHEVLIQEFGGAQGVRDLGLLESALLRPQTGYYANLIEEAAALWESLAMNHPFVDGNKRARHRQRQRRDRDFHLPPPRGRDLSQGPSGCLAQAEHWSIVIAFRRSRSREDDGQQQRCLCRKHPRILRPRARPVLFEGHDEDFVERGGR
jgi:hypothetical protein